MGRLAAAVGGHRRGDSTRSAVLAALGADVAQVWDNLSGDASAPIDDLLRAVEAAVACGIAEELGG